MLKPSSDQSQAWEEADMPWDDGRVRMAGLAWMLKPEAGGSGV